MLKKYGLLLTIVVILGVIFFLSSSEDALSWLQIEKDPPPEIRYELWVDVKACYEEDKKIVEEALKGRSYPNRRACSNMIDRWYGILMKEGETLYVPGIVNMQHTPGTEEEKNLLDIQAKYSVAAFDYSRVLLKYPDSLVNTNQHREEIIYYRENYKKAKKEIEDIFYW